MAIVHDRPDLTVRAGDAFAFYGILMRDSMTNGVGSYGEDCALPGRLWSVHDAYPAIELTLGAVSRGRLWTVPEDEDLRRRAVAELDAIEGFCPHDLERSMYLRQRVRLVEPDTVAWVYVWNYGLEGLRWVPSGDWTVHLERLRRN